MTEYKVSDLVLPKEAHVISKKLVSIQKELQDEPASMDNLKSYLGQIQKVLETIDPGNDDLTAGPAIVNGVQVKKNIAERIKLIKRDSKTVQDLRSLQNRVNDHSLYRARIAGDQTEYAPITSQDLVDCIREGQREIQVNDLKYTLGNYIKEHGIDRHVLDTFKSNPYFEDSIQIYTGSQLKGNDSEMDSDTKYEPDHLYSGGLGIELSPQDVLDVLN